LRQDQAASAGDRPADYCGQATGRWVGIDGEQHIEFPHGFFTRAELDRLKEFGVDVGQSIRSRAIDQDSDPKIWEILRRVVARNQTTCAAIVCEIAYVENDGSDRHAIDGGSVVVTREAYQYLEPGKLEETFGQA